MSAVMDKNHQHTQINLKGRSRSHGECPLIEPAACPQGGGVCSGEREGEDQCRSH